MKVLVINCGSSSLKYQLIDTGTEQLLASGLVERIGIEGSRLKHSKVGVEGEYLLEAEMKDHKASISYVLDALRDERYGVISDLSELFAVGHRVVHAGEVYSESVVIDEEVLGALKACIPLAPLHNPANIMGIESMRELLPEIPMVAVFDTAFHHGMPKEEYIYPLPYEYYEKYGIRRYGFHGTSHRYVTAKLAEELQQNAEDLRIISCHLGNGSSVAAIQNGKSLATSMGFTPLEGLVMGTRCGDIDPAIIPFLMEAEGLSVEEINAVLNKKSGVFGVSGVSSDFRDLEKAMDEGHERAALAIRIFNNRVKKYIGAYAALMGGLDVLVFTAGIGENSIRNREEICRNLEFLGIEFDAEANRVRGEFKLISKAASKVKVFVVPTNEELMIARDTIRLLDA